MAPLLAKSWVQIAFVRGSKHEIVRMLINAKGRKTSEVLHMKGMHHAKPSRETDVGHCKTIPSCHSALPAAVRHILPRAMLEL